MDVATSPFVFDGPVPPADLVDREDELAALRDRASHGRYVVLYAPRRYGKTSLIHALEAQGQDDRSLAVVAADLEGVLTLEDIARRLEDAYRRLPEGRVRRALVRAAAGLVDLGVSIGAGPVRVAPSRRPDETTAVLERLLDLPLEAARRESTRVLVVLDEFQALGSVPNADAVLRSKIQHQRAHVSYLFSGSEQGMLRTIFQDRARPLYGQAEQMALGPLPSPALAEFIGDRFEATGRDAGEALAPLLGTAAGHPQRAALLAHHLWNVVGEGGRGDEAHWAEALARTLRAVRPEQVAVWSALTDTQRRVVRLVAYGEPLHGSAAARLGLPKSSASRAAHALVARSLLTEDQALVDPLLGAWVRASQGAP